MGLQQQMRAGDWCEPEPISGWELRDEEEIYQADYFRRVQQKPAKHSSSQMETSSIKLPSKQHLRRYTREPPSVPKYLHARTLHEDRHFLLGQLAQRPPSRPPQPNLHSPQDIAPPVPLQTPPSIEIASEKLLLFSGLKSEKKRRRRIYLKTKMPGEFHEIQKSEEIASRKSLSSENLIEIWKQIEKQNRCNRDQEGKESRWKAAAVKKISRFPLFYRESQTLLASRTRKQKPPLARLQATSCNFSLEFVDDSIFTTKFLQA